jgi:hypothetical protein
MALSNPFIDQGDGHVLADDMEKRRETFYKPTVPVANPFLTGVHPVTHQPGYGLPLPALDNDARKALFFPDD